MIDYPNKVTHKGLIFYADEPGEGRNRRGRYYAFIGYSNLTSEITGFINLNEGWQDSDRTYTAQDIYWEDKYDCLIEQLAAAQI